MRTALGFVSFFSSVLCPVWLAHAAELRETSGYYVGAAFGATLDDGSLLSRGAFATRVFGGARITRWLSFEAAASYLDYHARTRDTAVGAVLSTSLELRLELPLLTDRLRIYARGGGQLSHALSFFRRPGDPDLRGETTGPGLVAAGGLRLLLWRNDRSRASLFVGAELAAIWIYPRMDTGGNVTTLKLVSLPAGVEW